MLMLENLQITLCGEKHAGGITGNVGLKYVGTAREP